MLVQTLFNHFSQIANNTLASAHALGNEKTDLPVYMVD